MQESAIDSEPPSNPWERRPTETPKAFAALQVYLDFGADRSLDAVGRKLGKSKALIERWSSKWEWQNRAAAYDAELAKREIEARAAARGDAAGMAEIDELRERLLTEIKRLEAVKNLALAKVIERLSSVNSMEIAARDIPNWMRAIAALQEACINERALMSGVTDILTGLAHAESDNNST